MRLPICLYYDISRMEEKRADHFFSSFKHRWTNFKFGLTIFGGVLLGMLKAGETNRNTYGTTLTMGGELVLTGLRHTKLIHTLCLTEADPYLQWKRFGNLEGFDKDTDRLRRNRLVGASGKFPSYNDEDGEGEEEMELLIRGWDNYEMLVVAMMAMVLREWCNRQLNKSLPALSVTLSLEAKEPNFNPNPAHHEPWDDAVLTSQEAQIAVEEEREIETIKAEYVSWSWWGYEADDTNFRWKGVQGREFGADNAEGCLTPLTKGSISNTVAAKGGFTSPSHCASTVTAAAGARGEQSQQEGNPVNMPLGYWVVWAWGCACLCWWVLG
ncbi:hypothetical protein BDZ91DRAFT_766017 [Kalaharituber pfeilii]|nr:hypothetical protein BDZ91DRAFT_766017 [Kalaharituber pfeilii]